MISYVTLGTHDMNKAKAFYTELLADLGAKVLLDLGRIAMIGESFAKPMIAVCIPHNKEAPSCGNGTMVAIPAGSRENVDKLYAKAISLGATCEGQPGERMPTFYGAYVRDPDGNKLAFVKLG